MKIVDRLLYIAVAAIAGLSPPAVTALSYELAYTLGEIETGEAVQQTVMAARLYDPVLSDLVVIRVDEDDARYLSIFRLDGRKYRPEAHKAIWLDDELILTDKGRLGGRDAIFFFTKSHLLKLDPDTLEFERVIAYSSIYNAPLYQSLPKINLIRDISGDGLDDVVIPDFDGYWVYLQEKDGELKDKAKLGVRPIMEMSYNKYPWYQTRQLYKGDYDLDGLQDLLFWNGDEFQIYYQRSGEGFIAEADYYEPPVALKYETADRISFRREDQNSTAAFLYKIADLDGDGVSDLITLAVASKGVFKKKTTYEIYKGSPSSDGTLFSDQPATRIESQGVQFNMDERDLDQDGQMDVMLSAVEIGLGKIIAALITGSVSFDLEFYRMEDGVYPESPNTSRKITARFNLSSGDIFFPSVLTTDVTGDGIDDLLVQHRRDKLKIFTGSADEKLFSKRSVDITVEMPSDPTLIGPEDLDGDGKQDILMQFKSEDNSGRIKTLIFD